MVIKLCWRTMAIKQKKEEERLISLLSYNIDGLILAERTHTPKKRSKCWKRRVFRWWKLWIVFHLVLIRR